MAVDSRMHARTGYGIFVHLHGAPMSPMPAPLQVGNLPLVFVRALCTDRGSVFWRTSGPADHCERLGVAYTAIDICAATLFQFSIAVQMLRPKPAPVQLDPEARRAASLDCAVGPAAGSLPRLEKTPTCSDLLAHADSSAGRSSPRAFRGSAPGLSLDGVQMTELQQGRRPPGGPRSLPGALEQEQLLPTTVQQGQHEFWVPRGRSWRERLRGAWRWLRGVDVAAAFPIPTQVCVCACWWEPPALRSAGCHCAWHGLVLCPCFCHECGWLAATV